MNKEQWMIIANGEPLTIERLSPLLKNKGIIALDGAAYYCLEKKIVPDVILGDFDSIDLESLKSNVFFDQTTFIHTPDQNKTDAEKAILYLDSLHVTEICLCNAFGSRADHSLYNMILLRKYHAVNRRAVLIREEEQILYFKDQDVCLKGIEGSRVAIMGFSKAIVSTFGLKYNLDIQKLEYMEVSSICNQLDKKESSISIKGEVVLMLDKEIELV